MFSKRDLKILESIMMLYEVKRSKGKKSAAKNLSTSIDTLNKYLENLEDELGEKLLTVNKHRCELTEYGKKTVVVAEKIKNCLLEMYQRASLEKELRGEVKIAYERSACLPEMRRIYKTYPQISFCFDTIETISEIKNHLYDICLCYTIPRGDDFAVVYAKEIPCAFFASPRYLEQNGTPKDIEDLFSHHRLVLKEDFLEQLGIRNKKAFQLVSNNSFLIKDAIAHDAGVGVLPFVEAYKNENLVCLRNIDCKLKCFLYLISYRKVKDKPRIREILNYYKASLQRMTFSNFDG